MSSAALYIILSAFQPSKNFMPVSIKTPEEIEKMRVAGRLAGELLDYITPFVRAGISTDELDKL